MIGEKARLMVQNARGEGRATISASIEKRGATHWGDRQSQTLILCKQILTSMGACSIGSSATGVMARLPLPSPSPGHAGSGSAGGAPLPSERGTPAGSSAPPASPAAGAESGLEP